MQKIKRTAVKNNETKKDEYDLINSIMSLKLNNEIKHLEEFLKPQSIDPKNVAQRLDEIDYNHLIVGKLLIQYNSELQKVKLDNELWYSKVSTEALDYFNKLKENKQFSGQISAEKVKCYIATNYPEYEKFLKKINEFEMVIAFLNKLSELYRSKHSGLQSIAKNVVNVV